jgi:uncharacterized protein YggE
MRPTSLLAIIFIFSPPLTAAATDLDTRPHISVTGSGEVNAAPDLAVLSFAVETTAKEASAAAAANAALSSALAAAIKAKLNKEDQVTTTRYSLDPTYEQHERGSSTPPRISGYVARNEVRVQTRNIDQVGELVDAATGAGANRISGLSFTLEDRADALADALKRAGADARHQAEAIAAALGVELGEIISASTGSAPLVIPRHRGMAMAMESSMTPIDAGDVKVSAMLNVVWGIGTK